MVMQSRDEWHVGVKWTIATTQFARTFYAKSRCSFSIVGTRRHDCLRFAIGFINKWMQSRIHKFWRKSQSPYLIDGRVVDTVTIRLLFHPPSPWKKWQTNDDDGDYGNFQWSGRRGKKMFFCLFVQFWARKRYSFPFAGAVSRSHSRILYAPCIWQWWNVPIFIILFIKWFVARGRGWRSMVCTVCVRVTRWFDGIYLMNT